MNPADVAYPWIGISKHAFWEEHCRPPMVVNCYVLVSWAFERCGIQVPQTLLGQLYAGNLAESHEAQDGYCLIFTKGKWNNGGYFDAKRAVQGVGHVGIVSCQGTVIHSSVDAGTIVEEPLESFLDSDVFRGIYRIR